MRHQNEEKNHIYPHPKNKKEENLVKYLGEYNEEIVNEAIKLIEEGNSLKIGELMTKAQNLFDKNVMPLSQELLSPILHSVLNNQVVKSLSLGGKGVGSQGDGSVQFIVENSTKQKELIKYLNNTLDLEAYSLKINKNI